MTPSDPHSHHAIVVSHTHWDRAWYLPFERFRVRLVRLVERLLDLLESDPDYRAFTLDGQTVLLEDVLAVCPEYEPRIRRLIADERLFIGPWYTLPDLFLVSGEAIIRNLQEGHRHCERFDTQMPVGYIPDPFGHIAQMPQILQGFGIDTYLFMRGMDAKTKADLGGVFHWEAPNGDRVWAIYQPDGYFPAAALGHPHIYGRFDGHTPDVEDAETQVREAVETMDALQEERTVLLSNGFDHMPEQPELPDLLDALNERLDDIHLTHGTLPQFVDALKAEADAHEHGTYRGDLLGNVDHPILSSVYSTRMYLKRQNHRAQRLLSRYAEPMSAWVDATTRAPDPRPLLRHLWKTLLRNHPHDDICGCSVDPVHEDDEVRFRHVLEAGDELLTEHLEHVLKAGGMAEPAHTGEQAADVWVFNPHPFRQTYRVETTVFIPTDDGTRGAVPQAEALVACDAAGVRHPVTILKTTDDVMRNPYLEQTWGRRYRVAFTVDVPPLGYHLVHIHSTDAASVPSDVADETLRLENEHYWAAVEDGSVTLHDKSRDRTIHDVLRYEYQLDTGDTYSFGPVPDHGPWWAVLDDVQRHPDRPDALRLHHTLRVPARYDRETGPQGETTLHLTTDLALGPHRALEMDVRYENTARDGRLRAVLPANTTTRTAWADGHFRWAKRTKPSAEPSDPHSERHSGYPGERAYPTHHQGDGVLVEDGDRRTWVANRGLPEYELLDPDGETHIAITLHRAVGHLSVEGGRIRDCQAGPSVPTPGAQCQRPMRAELAYGTGTLSRTAVRRHMRAYAHPAWSREMPALPHVEAGDPQPRAASFVTLDNPHVTLSAFAPGPEAGTHVLRLVNRSADAQSVTATFGFPVTAACPTNVHERWIEETALPVTNRTLSLDLDGHAIQTVLLRRSESAD